tara:strand:+ start:179 stop:550 length:372 start_codon:yes stop_codon:yes gene_type:complete
MFNVKDAAFTKLLGAYPQSFDAGAMRPTYLEAWEDLPDAVVSRTVDWFIKNWQRCPTLNEFMQQSQREHTLQRSSNQKREMANCRKCDSGWIEVGEDSGQFKPCESCRPETFENWATGEYAPS